ncbi:MAG: NifU family protein [Ignavibacteria bacterium]|nr:NifU family protein [Ignavibacteria bacterium]
MQSVTVDDVKKVLEKVRPYLQQDGGDVEVINVTDDNIVEVRLLGACKGCPMSMMTLRAGIERIIMLELPDVKRVESVN